MSMIIGCTIVLAVGLFVAFMRPVLACRKSENANIELRKYYAKAQQEENEMIGARMKAYQARLLGRVDIDAWLKARCEHLSRAMNEHLAGQLSLDDPKYRVMLGQHQAYMTVRSYISGCRRAGDKEQPQ